MFMVKILQSLERILNAASNVRSKAIIRQRAKAVLKDFKGRVVVYTAIFGGKDKLQEVRRMPGVDFVCFTDDDNLRSKTWKIIKVNGPYADPRKNAKLYKVLPHRYFKDHDYSLWVDGTHVPIVDCRYLVHQFLNRDDMALFAHRKRKCVYQEMEACVNYNKADRQIVKKQEEKYKREAYPADHGLAECTVILRRHQSPKVIKAMEDWWQEIESFTLRDQLSFNYIAFRHHLSYALLPGNVHENPFFSFSPHTNPDRSRLNIGWLLNGTQQTASSRIMGYNVHEYLLSQKIYSKIFYIPQSRLTSRLDLSLKDIDEILNFNINMLVIVKINAGENLDYLIQSCRKRKIKVVYAVCDLPSIRMVSLADATIASSSYFYKIIPKKFHHQLFIAFDGYEQSRELQKVQGPEKNVKLVCVTNMVWDSMPCIKTLPPHVQIKIIGPSAKILRTSFKHSALFKKSPFDVEYVDWEPETVYREILDGDIAIIPWPEINEAQKVKSINRLVMFMALGLPVIASPVPSYLEIIKHHHNGFIATKPEEWEKYIVLLRDDLKERQRIGNNARESVLDLYSKEKQGELYLDIFNKILKRSISSGPDPQ